MRDVLLSRAQAAVELAKAAGASDAFASASQGREVEFSLRDGKLENVKDATSRGIELRLYVDGRYSQHETTDLRESELRSFVDEAVALTRALQPDPSRSITDPALYEGRSTESLELWDDTITALSRERRMELVEAQNVILAGKDKVISATSGIADGHVVSALASSNGFSGTSAETYLWIGSDVTLQDAGDSRPEGSLWAGGVAAGAVPTPEEVAEQAMARARARLGTKKGPTMRSTMVVDPSIASSILGRLLSSANGASLQQGRSFFADKLGKQVVSPLLTIVDDPLIKGGLASRQFDSEGIAARKLPILEAGVLQNLYIDTYYGKKLGMAPTTGGASNRVVTLGDRDLAALIADAGTGMYVTSWLGGNADPTTGDFSLGLRGHLIEGGKVGAPVGEMNVTGNLLELFSHLVAVGNDPWKYSSTQAPTLVFEDVQFSGA